MNLYELFKLLKFLGWQGVYINPLPVYLLLIQPCFRRCKFVNSGKK